MAHGTSFGLNDLEVTFAHEAKERIGLVAAVA